MSSIDRLVGPAPFCLGLFLIFLPIQHRSKAGSSTSCWRSFIGPLSVTCLFFTMPAFSLLRMASRTVLFLSVVFLRFRHSLVSVDYRQRFCPTCCCGFSYHRDCSAAGPPPDYYGHDVAMSPGGC